MNRILFIVLLIFIAGASLSAQSSARMMTSPIARALQPFVERGELIGAVTVVASKDKVLSVDPVGLRDREAKAPMPVDALFALHSESKSIEMTALMVLVDEGKVSVDDPVEKYIPEFAGIMLKRPDGTLGSPKNKLLVRHLFTHTSGLVGFPNWLMKVRPPEGYGNYPIEVTVKATVVEPLEFEPGTKFRYNSMGLAVAGRIVEVVSGISFAEFLQKRVFEPLGMMDTGYGPWRDRERVAITYKFDPKTGGLKRGLEAGPEWLKLKWYPELGGAMRSTAADMARYGMMFLNGGVIDGKRFLKESTVKMMMRKQSGPAVPNQIGFAWYLDERSPETRNWTGGASGVSLVLDRKQGLVMVWMIDQRPRPEAPFKAFEDTAILLYGQSK
jgi:CubicO group peptidase (beta-lactamase class C family)